MDRQELHPKKGSRPRKVGRVISIRFDAAYFFQRAVQYLDRHDLPRAEKYFRRSVELEPENAIHHCNLAGVLSELGSYEESNQILDDVISKIDSALSEVYFYMANNYANLGEYDQAEEYIVRYLEADPDGEFAPDAEEMLEILIEDFGGGEIAKQWQTNRSLSNQPQELSRRLLEEGKFLEASEHLENLICENPESIAARNNLSLAYFYLGKLEEAVSITQEVLERDPFNIHARCNLAVYYQQMRKLDELRNLLDGLAKVYPIQYDHTFKLATTMGILGRHEVASRLFKQLTKWGDQDPAVWHAYAAAACNQKKYGKAQKAWKKARQLSDNPSIPDFYLNALQEAVETGVPMEPVSYQFHIPYYEQFKQLKEHLESQQSQSPSWMDPLVRSSLFWALKYGDEETKSQVIHTFAILNDSESVQALKEFVLEPFESDELKRAALFVLRQMGEAGAVQANLEGKSVTVRLEEEVETPYDRDPILRQVLEHLGIKLFGKEPKILEKAKEMWLQYLMRSIDSPPRIQQVEGWSAGLAYTAYQHLGIPVTQAELADLFGVSKATVSRTSRQIANKLQMG